MTNVQTELFDAEVYYVPPPPVKLKVSLEAFSYRGVVLISHRTALWDVYHQWKLTESPEDEQNLAEWLIDASMDNFVSEICVSDWEEI